jgi:hypothetical protein
MARMPHSDDSDFFALMSYRSLETRRPDLYRRLADRYLNTFFERASLDPRRKPDAEQLLHIDEGQSATGARALRIRFAPTGSTTEVGWDESDEEATAFVEEQALIKAEDWVTEREVMGPSEWDARPSP